MFIIGKLNKAIIGNTEYCGNLKVGCGIEVIKSGCTYTFRKSTCYECRERVIFLWRVKEIVLDSTVTITSNGKCHSINLV